MTSLVTLRGYAVARTFFTPTTLAGALERLQFVQADPIRAPARAQDLTLRHRVTGYRAGDLERGYPTLGIEEDFFVNYGFVTRGLQRLMHPRTPRVAWSRDTAQKAAAIVSFVDERGEVHPRDVDAHFGHGTARNWFGGRSKVATQLLDGLHYRGQLRVTRREGGVRVYALQPAWPSSTDSQLDALIDVVVKKYAPLPAQSLGQLVAMLRAAAPQWANERRAALLRAKQRLPHARVAGVEWYWPADEQPSTRPEDRVRVLAPFDPAVWDRRRFELLWGWAYRFEAYTPVKKRVRGYYALPVLWRDEVVGWVNAAVQDKVLNVELGFATRDASRERGFKAALNAELASLAKFLGVDEGSVALRRRTD